MFLWGKMLQLKQFEHRLQPYGKKGLEKIMVKLEGKPYQSSCSDSSFSFSAFCKSYDMTSLHYKIMLTEVPVAD